MPTIALLAHAEQGFEPRNPSSLAPGLIPDHQVIFFLHKALLPTEGCGPKGLDPPSKWVWTERQEVLAPAELGDLLCTAQKGACAGLPPNEDLFQAGA